MKGLTLFLLSDPKKDTLRRAYNQGCPLNMRSLPEDDIPVSSIIAEYASDQVTSLGHINIASNNMTLSPGPLDQRIYPGFRENDGKWVRGDGFDRGAWLLGGCALS